MRTTLDIDSVVLAQLEHRRRKEGKTLGQLVSELLARELARENSAGANIAWVSAGLGRPVVDLEDTDALNAALERDI